MKTFAEVKAESTCRKRAVICELYDADGSLLARESNRCDPPGGVCSRLEITNTADDYPADGCNWAHAEARALAALPEGASPRTAFVYGHDFVCGHCWKRLAAAGITEVTTS